MDTKTLVAAALLLTATFALVPSAQAAPPIQCVMAPCGPGGGDPVVPPICGETVNCEGPHCGETTLDSWDLAPQLAFHVVVEVHDNCSVDVTQTGTPCSSLADQVAGAQTVGPVDVTYQSCRLNPDCTCDPLPIELTSAESPPGIQPPPQCVTQPCCFAPCPPPCDGCDPDPVRCRDTRVATSDLLAYLGPHAGVWLRGDCSVDAWESGMVCPTNTNPTTVSRDVGPAGVSVAACSPALDCTCDPLPIEFTTAAAIEPPIKVEPVVCVTDPCPPMVWCAEREVDGAYLFGAYVENDCSVTVGVIDGHRLCGFNGLEHHQIRQTVGPVTLVINYCGVVLR